MWLSLAGALPALAIEARAGGFIFSDELGGFDILGASGEGTRDDPVVVEQSLTHVEPIIMVIRRDRLDQASARRWVSGWLTLHLKIVVHNDSGRAWQGFEVELQEDRDQPSVYGDGLSFDQGSMVEQHVASDRFARNERLFEPFDRIRFEQGAVDTNQRVTFTFHITDPTPADTFYLLEDPRIVFASLLPFCDLVEPPRRCRA